MDEGLISVIVPIYNVEPFLATCLDSILNQSYRRLEVILIDDGSTDFSLKIAETYAEKDDRVTVYSYPNSGQSAARNRGLEVATGQFITFVDADDLLLPDALEIMYNFICKEDISLVEGKVIKAKFHDKKFSVKQCKTYIFNPEEAMVDVLYQNRLLPSPCGKLYKKELFEGLRFEKGLIYEDLNIFYKVLERCNKIIWIDYPVYFYRENENSTLHTWKPQRLDVLEVTKNLEEYIEEKYPRLLPAAKDRRLSANFNMFALCSIHGDHETAKKCWVHIKENRRPSLWNSKVRLKNKTGILLSYLGKNTFKFISRFIYK